MKTMLLYRGLPADLQKEIKRCFSCTERWGISSSIFTDICRRNRPRVSPYYTQIRRHHLPNTIRYHKDNTFSLPTSKWGKPSVNCIFSVWSWQWIRQQGRTRIWSIILHREWWLDICPKETGEVLQISFLPGMTWQTESQWPLRIEYDCSIYPQSCHSLHYRLLELATWVMERQDELTALHRKGVL